jgi:hypothetical protein
MTAFATSWSDATRCRRAASDRSQRLPSSATSVCRGCAIVGDKASCREIVVKPVGKPDAGNPHVRFDERGRETGRGNDTAPFLDSTGPPRFLPANQNCNRPHDRTICANPAARRSPWSPTHFQCVNDLFLIRTEKGRRTTGNTEPRMLLAESLTEQVIGFIDRTGHRIH